MAFLPNNAMFSSKYLNAMIKDAGGRIKIVHVKNYIGDYFVTTINQKPYVFKVIDKEVGVIDEFGIKKYRVASYSTKHYRPISDHTDAIKHMLEDNSLPKINIALFNVIRNLGKREKKDFEKHDVEKILDELIKVKDDKLAKILGYESKYQEAAAEVIDFLNSLSTKEIVTPLKGIAEYIEEDLIATDPSYAGTVITTHQRTDIEHKKITNIPVGPKRPYAILLAILFGVALAIMGVYLLIDNGTFDGMASMFPDLSGFKTTPVHQPVTPGSVLDRYPTPEAAKAAIDRGEASINDFPPEMRPLISSVKAPTATAVTP